MAEIGGEIAGEHRVREGFNRKGELAERLVQVPPECEDQSGGGAVGKCQRESEAGSRRPGFVASEDGLAFAADERPAHAAGKSLGRSSDRDGDGGVAAGEGACEVAAEAFGVGAVVL